MVEAKYSLSPHRMGWTWANPKRDWSTTDLYFISGYVGLLEALAPHPVIETGLASVTISLQNDLHCR